LIVYFIALFLFLLELPKIKDHFYNLFTESTGKKVKQVIDRLVSVIKGFWVAQFVLSIVVFVISLITLLFIAPKYAVLMSIIIWVIDIIPIIGSIVIFAPWALIAFLFGDVLLGVQLLILSFVIILFRRTVEPKIMGDQMGLSPLLMLISLFIGLQLLGFIGFIIGPLVVIVYKAAREVNLINFNIKF
jgi:sporulation integral membrane protein YtvI